MPAAVEGTITPATQPPPMAPQNGAPPPADQVQPPNETPPVAAPPAVTPPEEPKPAPKDRTTEAYLRMAQKERKLVEESQRIARARAQIKAEADALAAERTQYQEMTQKLEAAKTNPGGLLRSLYGDDWYDRLTKYQLAGEETPPAEMQVQAVREELERRTAELERSHAELQAKIESERKASVERERARLKAEAEEEIERFNREAVDFVKANASRYELTNLYEQQDLVTQLIQATYEQSAASGKPRVLSLEEATAAVEQYLADEVAKAERLKQQKAQPVAAQPPPATTPPAPTLTNAMGGTPAPSPGIPKTVDDRIARALAVWDAKQQSK
jgi:hypothetical protein